MQPSVREALAGDAQRIAQLCGQLGYNVPLEHVEHVLALPRPDSALYVAVVPRAGVVGWISVSVRLSLLSGARAEIEGLVVEDEYRGSGTGTLLAAAAESWARRRGCTQVRVASNAVRERAHRFYLRNGYRALKTQTVFGKDL
ncbi:MAG: GNAT family N-acetyltransferase [Candidatus Baltobacteraceae bacterium]